MLGFQARRQASSVARRRTISSSSSSQANAEGNVTSKIIASSRTKNLVPIRTNIRGSELLNTPRLNKGAAFSREERSLFGLTGMLPWEVHPLEKQVARAYAQLQKQPTTILKHAFLASMRDQNQVLFFRLMQDHLKELLGILYTPGECT